MRVDTARAERWSFPATPSLVLGEIGLQESGTAFFGVSGGLLLSDRRFVVLDAGNHELRWFDLAGTVLGRFGRRGRGPGEFIQPTRLLPMSGDTVAVWDEGLRRITLVDPAGELVDVVTIGDRIRGPELVAILPGSRFVIIDRRPTEVSGDGVQEIAGREIIVDRSGAVVDSMGAHPWRRAEIIQFPNGSAGGRLMNFDVATMRAVTPTGTWIGAGRKSEVEWFGADGARARLMRWEGVPARVSEADKATLLAERLRGVGSRSGMDAVREDFETQSWSGTFPQFSDISADESGRLWVAPYDPPGREGSRPWLVLSVGGDAAVIHEAPPGRRLLSVRDGMVLSLHKDAYDVERVELWRVGRNEASRHETRRSPNPVRR